MKVVKFKKRGENMTIEQEALFIEVVDTAEYIWEERHCHLSLSGYVDAGWGAKYCSDLVNKVIGKGWTGPEFFQAVLEEVYLLFRKEYTFEAINVL